MIIQCVSAHQPTSPPQFQCFQEISILYSLIILLVVGMYERPSTILDCINCIGPAIYWMHLCMHYRLRGVVSWRRGKRGYCLDCHWWKDPFTPEWLEWQYKSCCLHVQRICFLPHSALRSGCKVAIHTSLFIMSCEIWCTPFIPYNGSTGNICRLKIRQRLNASKQVVQEGCRLRSGPRLRASSSPAD